VRFSDGHGEEGGRREEKGDGINWDCWGGIDGNVWVSCEGTGAFLGYFC
jgi:hypothetical protein